MNENKKTSKMTKADKIVVASTVTVLAGMGVASGIYLHKQHLLAIKAVTEHNEMLGNALGETISLVAESLKK